MLNSPFYRAVATLLRLKMGNLHALPAAVTKGISEEAGFIERAKSAEHGIFLVSQWTFSCLRSGLIDGRNG